MKPSKLVVLVMAVAMACGCTRKEYVENVIEFPVYPDLEEIHIDTLRTIRADVEFYGAYSQTVDRWYLTLFTSNDVTYDLTTDRYSGSGKVIKLCLQTQISDGTDKDIPVMAQMYSAPQSYSDLVIGQFETGYYVMFDHPSFGSLEGWYGTYAVNLDAEEYLPYAFTDGVFSVEQTDGGNYRVSGMLVDEFFTKNYFVYEGPLGGVTEYDFPGAPNSSISQDVTLTRSDLPKLEIRDKGDQYRYDNSFRNYRVYLTGADVQVSEVKSIFERVKLAGSGPVVLLDLFVSPDAGGKIPAGTYKFCPRESNNGILGQYIKPFYFVAGYPRRFSDPQGCWFFNLKSDGYWGSDYAMVNGGTLTVSYEEGSETPAIRAEFNDSSKPSHKVIIDWK